MEIVMIKGHDTKIKLTTLNYTFFLRKELNNTVVTYIYEKGKIHLGYISMKYYHFSNVNP